MASPITAISNALTLPGGVSAAEMREKIVALEAAIKATADHLTAKDFKTTHHFAPGLYMRELFIPKDTILTGRIHKTAHHNILSQGKITVWTEDGMKTLTASTVIMSQSGIKRVGYTHEDSIWITVHHNPTNETDVEKVDAMLTVDTFEEFYLASQKTMENMRPIAAMEAEGVCHLLR